ncbi:hypothetical protein BH10PSE12_BH10PSE12_07420 [soil metagenome]
MNETTKRSDQRIRILSAARELIETNQLSMRNLAKQANVGHVTPYKLFKSKQDVIVAVANEEISEFQDKLSELHSQDALDRILDSIRLTNLFLIERESLYKAVVMFQMFGDQSANEDINGPRRAAWVQMIQDAVSDGFLEEVASIEDIVNNIFYINYGALTDWSRGLIKNEQMNAAVGFGIVLSILGIATRKGRKRLDAELDLYIRALADSRGNASGHR